ncbi:uncharacterized protein LOC141783078 [Sebastes fasciatus]|uniref:uncharacterized protein LOC141783078 n=1 Tax=Sebastes fasciatus TaxID=394691 RepID=UPI003D9F60E1
MSNYTRRSLSPPEQYNIAGKRHDNVYTQAQHDVVPGRRADGADRPFPNKPVSHRRPPSPGRQDSQEKITITKQPRASLSPQEHHSNGIRKTTGSRDPRKDSHRQPSGEVQMARAIHAKQLILQEKLWSVEEKIRQKIRRDAAAGDVQKSEEQRHDRGRAERGNTQTKSRPSEQQRREPARGREMMMQERGQEDVKQLRKTQDQRNEDSMRNTHEEERARGKRREIEYAQSQRKGHKGTHRITVPEEEVSGELHKSRWENVKEHTRRKGGDEKDNGIWGETSVKSQDGTGKAKERQQTTSAGDKGWTGEKKYRESSCKEMISDDERDMPQMSQQKISHKAATENHRGAGGRTLSGVPQPPLVSHPSHSSRPELRELRQETSTDAGLQLLPCTVCNRKFTSERLEKHVQICAKFKQSHRPVFNSYVSRTKGSAIEQFWKTHSRSKSPEVLKKKNQRQNHKVNTRNLHEGRLPAGTSQPKWSK